VSNNSLESSIKKLQMINELDSMNLLKKEVIIKLQTEITANMLNTENRSKKELKIMIKEKPKSTIINILFLSADPSDVSRLRLNEEYREIKEKLQLSRLRRHFKLALPQLSLRPVDISQSLLDEQPQIVHFSGHGALTGELCFEDQFGKALFIKPDALEALFEQFSTHVNCVLLNACYSELQANAIAKHIKYVIGMNKAIGDKAAIAFSIGFYQGIGAGRTIVDAYKLGCVQIKLQGIPESLTPVLKFPKEISVQKISKPPEKKSSVSGNLELRKLLERNFSIDELTLLCADITDAFTRDNIQEKIDLQIIGGSTLPMYALNLVQYLDHRGYLNYLGEAIRVARPNLL
jgi:hypothetical protein